MTRGFKIWLVVAALFSAVNLYGLVIAAVRGEMVHAGIHAALLGLAAYLVWHFAPRRVAGY